MAWTGKVIGIALLGFIAILILKEWILLPIGIIIVLFLIRWIADIYWSGKDNGRW